MGHVWNIVLTMIFFACFSINYILYSWACIRYFCSNILWFLYIYTHIVAVYYISYINYIKAYKQSPIHASNCIPHTEMVWYGLNHLISAPGSWSTLVFYIHTWENGTQLLCLLNLFGGLKPPSTVGFAYWTWNSLKLLQFILFHTEKSLQSG